MFKKILILIFLSFSFNQINILIVGDSNDFLVGLENYQNEVPLSDRTFNISAVDSAEDICGMDYIDYNLDVILLNSNTSHCNWVDIIPQLDTFMRNGGDVFILGNNSFPNSINSSTGWPDYYGDYISEEDMMDWFFDVSPMVLSDHGGIAIVNSDCSNDPIYNNVHTYPGC